MSLVLLCFCSSVDAMTSCMGRTTTSYTYFFKSSPSPSRGSDTWAPLSPALSSRKHCIRLTFLYLYPTQKDVHKIAALFGR